MYYPQPMVYRRQMSPSGLQIIHLILWMLFLILNASSENIPSNSVNNIYTKFLNKTSTFKCQPNITSKILCAMKTEPKSFERFLNTREMFKNLELKRKKIRKRQVSGRERCGDLPPPQPGKASCTIRTRAITCLGTCANRYKFSDGSRQQLYSCNFAEGVWKPSNVFPSCEPECKPPCQNGGNCTTIHTCACPPEYRGDLCQYPITLCGLDRNFRPSSWQCNHTSETVCDIGCHPPGSPQAERDSQRYVCDMQGRWSRQLPECVQVPQCQEPKIENGFWKLIIGINFVPGSKILYFCNNGYTINGPSKAFCQLNNTWSETAECSKNEAISHCEDPGEIINGDRILSSDEFWVGSTLTYECRKEFTLMGIPQLFCQPGGIWSSKKPTCMSQRQMAAFCPRPSVPKNAVIHVSFTDQHPLNTHMHVNVSIEQKLFLLNFTLNHKDAFPQLPESVFMVGTRVQYKCNSKFYKLYGSEYQTCMSSSQWSGYQPACIPECGRADLPKTPFVVNGKSTAIGQWPWIVGIALYNPNKGAQLVCGASLISELWVLTAAHCVVKMHSNAPINKAELLLFFGKYHRSFEEDDEEVQVKRVNQILIHKDYDFIRYDADIALLQLESPVTLTHRVQPICLPTEETTRENVRDGKEGIVIGWGLTEDGKFAESLRETTMPVVEHKRCEAAYKENLRSVTVTPNMFCAGLDTGLTDTCSGDSGGPFMFADINTKRWFVEGLVSWGSKSGCAKASRYSGFTKVDRFISWINMFI